MVKDIVSHSLLITLRTICFQNFAFCLLCEMEQKFRAMQFFLSSDNRNGRHPLSWCCPLSISAKRGSVNFTHIHL